MVSPIMPNFSKQEFESPYKYFSASSPKFAKTGKLSFRNSKFDFIVLSPYSE